MGNTNTIKQIVAVIISTVFIFTACDHYFVESKTFNTARKEPTVELKQSIDNIKFITSQYESILLKFIKLMNSQPALTLLKTGWLWTTLYLYSQKMYYLAISSKLVLLCLYVFKE